MKPKYHRVLLKLSGEALAGPEENRTGRRNNAADLQKH